MPIVKEREYRAIIQPLIATQERQMLESDYYVEGYATTFNQPYVLYEFEDGSKIYEQIDRNALVGADLSDVIFQYNHEGRVFARNSNGTLALKADDKGIRIGADLGQTDLARGMYQDIKAGMVTKMSWAFTIAEETWDEATQTRTITKVKKVYDVSAVSFPANPDTEIKSRTFAIGRREAKLLEEKRKRIRLMSILAE